MLYPRIARVGEKDILVADDQMVGYKEHMTQEYLILYLDGIITGDPSPRHLLGALDTPLVNPKHSPIKLFITSPGGDLDTTFLFYDVIKTIKSPVITIGEYCASAAAILLAAGNKRYLRPHAKVMLHLPSNYFAKDTAIQIQDMEIIQNQTKKYKERMVEILIDCGAKKSREEILIDIDRDYWMEPEEAIEYGLADEILTPNIWEEWINV